MTWPEMGFYFESRDGNVNVLLHTCETQYACIYIYIEAYKHITHIITHITDLI